MSRIRFARLIDRLLQVTATLLLVLGLAAAYAVAVVVLVIAARWLPDHGLVSPLLVIAGILPGVLLALLLGTAIAVPLYVCGVLILLHRPRVAPARGAEPAPISAGQPPNPAT